MENLHLLDYLSQQCGCDCLSNLRFSPKLKIELKKTLMTCTINFPLSDWNDTIHYLFNEPKKFKSITEIKEYFKI